MYYFSMKARNVPSVECDLTMIADKKFLVLICWDCPRTERVKKKHHCHQRMWTHIPLGSKDEPLALELVWSCSLLFGYHLSWPCWVTLLLSSQHHTAILLASCHRSWWSQCFLDNLSSFPFCVLQLEGCLQTCLEKSDLTLFSWLCLW